MTSPQSTLRIALVGTGRMGQLVEQIAEERGHQIVARFDVENSLLDAHGPEVLDGADLCIDFSAPSVALDHIHRYCLWGVDAVVGTTGWYDDLEKVREWVTEGQNGLLYAANFSFGVAMLTRALRAVAPLVNTLDEFDIAIHEAHHTKKLDSPSGTAVVLAGEVLATVDRKTRMEIETVQGRIDEAALHVTSSRVGEVFGEHTVTIHGPSDVVTLAHRAQNRDGFARGAVRAAEWLPGRSGLFTLDDLLDDTTR
jgi:4-hydroxy-tetrahydrodipicolinate reductase